MAFPFFWTILDDHTMLYCREPDGSGVKRIAQITESSSGILLLLIAKLLELTFFKKLALLH